MAAFLLLRYVKARNSNEIGAMSQSQRFRRRISNIFTRRSPSLLTTNAGFDTTVQYRVEPIRMRKLSLMRLLRCNTAIVSSSSLGISNNQKLAMYLHWMFRVNFFFLFFVMCIIFFLLVMLFTGLIIGAGYWHPECVRIGGEKFTKANTAFANGFALSWTTFSTVGYGSTYPARGFENSNRSNCFLINFICSLEALIGVLYSGFCGAILFGKVLRIQSHAQVIFSDPLVIRYGTGVKKDDGEEAATSMTEGGGSVISEEQGGSANPVLEFRVINRLFNEVGGEIMDAELNVVANVDVYDSEKDNGGSPHIKVPMDSFNEADASVRDANGMSERGNFSLRLDRVLDPLRHQFSRRNRQQVIEDPSSRVTSKQMFSKMKIEANEHPFFKRVWLARHVLDEYSPILKPHVRRLIRQNRGLWPDRLNTHQGIRQSLAFNQILVSLNGVSNLSASSVYAQHIYDFVDITIGYQFVNLLYRDVDGTLGVDVYLINDVREQNGGGGEPLILVGS